MFEPLKSLGRVGYVAISLQSALPVIRIGRDRRVQLVDRIRELAVRVKREVSRTCARIGLHRQSIVALQFSLRRVETVYKSSIGPEIGGDRELSVRRNVHGMRVRSFLPAFVWTRSFVLILVRDISRSAVGLDRTIADAAAPVVRGQEVAPGLVHSEMARPGATRSRRTYWPDVYLWTDRR